MNQTTPSPSPDDDSIPVGDPTTSYESTMVALRSERHDGIELCEIVAQYDETTEIPDSFVVVERTQTYYGPKLILESGTENYLLTAPGPDSDLLLWASKTGPNGLRNGWQKLAEVSAEFAANLPQYDLCPHCGDPLKTLEHERMASFGECPSD